MISLNSGFHYLLLFFQGSKVYQNTEAYLTQGHKTDKYQYQI